MSPDLTSKSYELVRTLQLPGQTISVPTEPEAVQSNEFPVWTPEIWVVSGLAALVFLVLRTIGILRYEEEEATGCEANSPFDKAAPCPSCRFFSNNIYLKCAVHPSDVFTHQAVHCPDYCLVSQERSDQLTIPPKQGLAD